MSISNPQPECIIVRQYHWPLLNIVNPINHYYHTKAPAVHHSTSGTPELLDWRRWITTKRIPSFCEGAGRGHNYPHNTALPKEFCTYPKNWHKNCEYHQLIYGIRQQRPLKKSGLISIWLERWGYPSAPTGLEIPNRDIHEPRSLGGWLPEDLGSFQQAPCCASTVADWQDAGEHLGMCQN